MNIFLKKMIVILLPVIVLVGCNDEREVILDVNDLNNSIASIDGNVLSYNPVENVDNEVQVGVSTLSSVDRSFVLSQDVDGTTLESNFYEIQSLTGIIPAGSYFGSVIITTLGGENDVLPVDSRTIAISLESVENAVISTANGFGSEAVSIRIACPTSLSESDLLGMWAITVDPFGTFVGDGVFEIVSGENQVTALDMFDHPNPAGGVYDVILDVDYTTGTVSVDRQDSWHCVNFGCGFGQGRINGSGNAFNCIGTGNLKFRFQHTVDAGSFGTFAMEMAKQ